MPSRPGSQTITRRVRVAGIDAPVLQAGPDDATEAVVFVHGNPGPANDWQDLLTGAGEFARAVAPELPGFGAAEAPHRFSYTINGYAAHLGGIPDRLAVKRAHLVLHDFGGPWGLAWGLHRPQRMASVTLINTGVLPGYRWHHWARIWRTPLFGELFQLIATRRAARILLGSGEPGTRSTRSMRRARAGRPAGPC